MNKFKILTAVILLFSLSACLKYEEEDDDELQFSAGGTGTREITNIDMQDSARVNATVEFLLEISVSSCSKSAYLNKLEGSSNEYYLEYEVGYSFYIDQDTKDMECEALKDTIYGSFVPKREGVYYVTFNDDLERSVIVY